MIRVSANDFGAEVGRFQDAAQHEPVVVTRDGRDHAVMISAGEYLRLQRNDRRVFAAGDLPDRLVEAVRHAEMDCRHDGLDVLVKDWAP